MCIFHVFIGHLYVFFGSMSIQILCRFLKCGTSVFLLLHCKSSLCILDTNRLSYTYFANTFPLHQLSFHLMVSFDTQMCLIDEVQFIFLSCCLCFWCHSYETIAQCWVFNFTYFYSPCPVCFKFHLMTSNFRYHTISLLEVPLGYTRTQTHTHTYFTSFLILFMLFFRSLSTLYIVSVCSFYQLCHFQVCFYCLIFLLVMSPLFLLFGDSSDFFFFFLTGCWIF